MRKQLVINGVPDRIRLDGQWLFADGAETPTGPGGGDAEKPSAAPFRPSAPLLALFILILLADLLFWGHSRGISVAIFALALSVSVLAMQRRAPREWAIGLGFALICNLPVVEQLQPLSLLFSFIGLAGLVAWAGYRRIVEWWQALWAMLRVSTVGAFLLPAAALREVKGGQNKANLKQHAKSLILPLGVGLMFLLLLSSANPILEQFLDQFVRLDFLTAEPMARIAFWVGAASLLWPYLNLSGKWLGPALHLPAGKPAQAPGGGALVNAQSIRNSLILFNILFLVQTVMDIGVLSGGMSLPEGMSYAHYAHRGAYPLVATALLAGAFAVMIHKMIRENRFLRNLLFLWLGQNMFLVITAAFRLSLYVDAYSLTYLRIAAFIWMGLVFAGLLLTALQACKGKSIAWLIRSNLAVLLGALYVCSFVNFAHVIAEHNLQKQTPRQIDSQYICTLGEQALPAIRAHEKATQSAICTGYWAYQIAHEPIGNWREWGFRRWRLQVYLDGAL